MLKTLLLENFTVFSKAELEFSPGLNVIVGENGTGKTHLLKLGYAVMRVMQSHEKASPREITARLQASLRDIFKIRDYHNLCSFKQTGNTTISVSWGTVGVLNCIVALEPFIMDRTVIGGQLWLQPTVMNDELLKSTTQFIPAKEIISVLKGFRSTLKNRELDFDGTYLDLAEALDVPPYAGDMLVSVEKWIDPLEQIIQHSLRQVADGSFLFEPLKEEGKTQHPAHMAAEGHRKIGMLAYLIKNGSLALGSSLFWDEPEANLNPKLQAQLAEILVELSSVMQITIATHSLFLLREIEILQEKKKIAVPPKFFGLSFDEEGGVRVTEGKSLSFIGDTVALNMEIEQSTRYLNL